MNCSGYLNSKTKIAILDKKTINKQKDNIQPI